MSQVVNLNRSNIQDSKINLNSWIKELEKTFTELIAKIAEKYVDAVRALSSQEIYENIKFLESVEDLETVDKEVSRKAFERVGKSKEIIELMDKLDEILSRVFSRGRTLEIIKEFLEWFYGAKLIHEIKRQVAFAA
jgi:HD superfamily phosphohydrolase